MDIRKLDHIKLSLMEIKGTTSEMQKTDYIIKTSATFKFDDKIRDQITNENIHLLLEQIYEELKTNVKAETVDSIGVWLNYNGKDFDNSMKMETINDMIEYGDPDMSPIYEFCKMTLITEEL